MAGPMQQQIEGVAAPAGQRQDLIPIVDLQNLHRDHCHKSEVDLTYKAGFQWTATQLKCGQHAIAMMAAAKAVSTR